MSKLAKQQIERQDFVDNQIFELMQKLLPVPRKIEWNIEAIGTIRDAMRRQIVIEQRLISEAKFYP